ncbi:MAG: N-acetyltransferase [Actinomycetota bacterium]
MLSFDDHVQPPLELRTDEFLLRPIVASDAELDHEAVMESRDFLRHWEQSTWPEDDFSVEDNRADMRKLEQRWADRSSFSYTMMNLDETVCFGCIYVNLPSAPWFERAQITREGSGDEATPWGDHDTVVSFWVRSSRLDDGLDGRLLHALDTWLAEQWGFERVLFITNEQFTQQVTMYEDAGLQRRFRLATKGNPGDELAYASVG